MILKWLAAGLLVYGETKVHAGNRRPRSVRPNYGQLRERLRVNFPGESLNLKELVVLEETSIGHLPLDNKNKRSTVDSNSKAKSTYNDYDPYADGNVVESKTKYADDDTYDGWEKRTAEEHRYYKQTYNFSCYDKYDDQYFKVNETWQTERNITQGGDWKAIYKCRCEGGSNGRYICKPTQAPCYSKWTQKYHAVGSEFEIFANNDNYICYCYGGPTGKYECEEKEHGCFDSRHNKRKYRIGEKFTQHRPDNLIYDCDCQYGASVKERVIMCSLKRYCLIDQNNKREALMINDSFDIFNKKGQSEHRCTCERNPEDSRSNRLHCVPFPNRGRNKYRSQKGNHKSRAKSTEDEIDMKLLEEASDDYAEPVFGEDETDLDMDEPLSDHEADQLLEYGPYADQDLTGDAIAGDIDSMGEDYGGEY